MANDYTVRPNRLKRKWKAGIPHSWVLLDFMSADLVEILGVVGFDSVMLEGEHAAYNEGQILDICRAAAIHDMTPVIRLRSINFDQIGRLLDIGIQGIHATHIRSRAECDHLVNAAKYPPLGERGWGQFARINSYGLADEAKALAQGNEEIVLSVCIEDVEGAENIEDICQAEGIDDIAIGPSDLSASMGIPGDYENPKYKALIGKVKAAIANSRFADKPLFQRGGNIRGAAANKFIATSFRRLLEDGVGAY